MTTIDPKPFTAEEIHEATSKILADPLLHRFFNWSINGCRAIFGKCSNCGQNVGPGWDHEVSPQRFTCKRSQPAPLSPAELRELASLSYGDAAAHILKNETKLRGDLSTPYVAALHRLADAIERYDEAVRLIAEAEEILDFDANANVKERLRAFLAAEPEKKP